MGNLSPHLGHIHLWDRGVSRRQFLAGTAGAAAALAAPPLWATALAHEDEIVISPKPIPGGVTVGPPTISLPAVPIHHYPFVQTATPFNDPSEITDFRGFVTNCRVTGTGMGTDLHTGAHTPLLFQVDNGFMDGTYIGVDGKQHDGNFAFIWMDLFMVNPGGSRGTQVHDFSPGISSNGLFWVQSVADHTVDGDLDEGEATFRAELNELDAANLNNALHAGPTVPGTVSFKMRWTGTGTPFNFTSVAEGFTGRFLFSKVSVSWSARTRDFSFKSDPASTSVSVGGIMGEERNGVFLNDSSDND